MNQQNCDQRIDSHLQSRLDTFKYAIAHYDEETGDFMDEDGCQCSNCVPGRFF